MKTIFFHNLLISLTMQGFLWTLLLLLLCFAGVYVAELARVGWAYKNDEQKQSDGQKEEEKKTPAEKPQEPIYYIVEKKKRRPKSTNYGDPQPIQFKKN